MAANEYYNRTAADSPEAGHRIHSPLPPLPVPTSQYSAYTPTAPGHVDPPVSPSYDFPQSPTYHRQSQQSLDSDQRYYGVGGGGPVNEQGAYEDNIPLHPIPQRYSPEDGTAKPQGLFHDENGLLRARNERGRSRKRKSGISSGRIPWVIYGLTLIQVTVFIAELVKNAVLTKSPIEIHPSFNPMIGPSFYVQVNMGARYVPCMKAINGLPANSAWPCANTTSADSTIANQCTIQQLCGFTGYNDTAQPAQWFRFITPIFLHAGIVHISFNMLLQLTLGREMEKTFGSLRLFVVYMSSGIFGFVMGGNFAPQGIASTGASGALFGVIALMLLDLLYTWDQQKTPKRDLAWLAVVIIVTFVLGLLPGLDNFSHIGGFLMGLVLGVCILHSPNPLRRRIETDNPPYSSLDTPRKAVGNFGSVKGFVKQPLTFFKGRKPLWWAWWLVRVGALVGVLVCFILLLNNFYTYHRTCSWCKYLSCLPVNNWCNQGDITIQNVTTPEKRNVLGAVAIDFQNFY